MRVLTVLILGEEEHGATLSTVKVFGGGGSSSAMLGEARACR